MLLLAGATPVFYAATYGKTECVKYLANNGLTGLITTNVNGENPLHISAQGTRLMHLSATLNFYILH